MSTIDVIPTIKVIKINHKCNKIPNHKCNKILTMNVIWLTINVIYFDHKCNKYNVIIKLSFMIVKGCQMMF